MVTRQLAAALNASKRSILLLGPRQTGKSTLMKSLSPELTINLAHEPTFLDFARNPSELEQRLKGKAYQWVFVDEVQRLPSLLNTLQFILDEKTSNTKFYLTGSSARKLKRGGANLLPGRIHTYYLGPLTCKELDFELDIKQALSTGTLPGIWTDEDVEQKQKTLESYAATYLKEEIQAEAVSRNLEGFSRFLFVAAAESGKFLDLNKLASQSQIPRQSASRYFEILEDTLIVRRCDAFSQSTRGRLVQHPRFFFFDTGVLNGLLRNFTASPDRIGALFEHFVFNQLMDTASASDEQIQISSYRTEHGAEVDFIVEYKGDVYAIEAKASSTIGRSDLTGLKSFAAHTKKKHEALIVYLGENSKVIDNVRVLPVLELFKELSQ